MDTTWNWNDNGIRFKETELVPSLISGYFNTLFTALLFTLLRLDTLDLFHYAFLTPLTLGKLNLPKPANHIIRTMNKAKVITTFPMTS